jgi:hypothetical protein
VGEAAIFPRGVSRRQTVAPLRIEYARTLPL